MNPQALRAQARMDTRAWKKWCDVAKAEATAKLKAEIEARGK